LKPDVCRRVVGRLPSPHIQGSLQKPLWFQQRGMAPPFSLHSTPKSREKFTVVYLVRSSRTYARIRSLTTGTFNLVVKDRIAFRLSGANSVQANSHKCESDRPRNPTNILCCAKPCQRPHPTEFPLVFHIRKSGRDRATGERTAGAKPESSSVALAARLEVAPLPGSRSLKRATVWPSAWDTQETPIISAHAEAEDMKLGKDPFWRSLL